MDPKESKRTFKEFKKKVKDKATKIFKAPWRLQQRQKRAKRPRKPYVIPVDIEEDSPI